MGVPIDITGQKFNRLTAIEKTNEYHGGKRLWLCKCDCGGTTLASVTVLKSGHTKSCGCWKKEVAGAKSKPKPGSNLNVLYGQYKRSAKKRGLEFALSKVLFEKLVKGRCVYCNTLPNTVHNYKAKKAKPYMCNGIDRIDPTQGYIPKNCVSCCKTCNYMKQSLQQQDFLDQIERIYFNRIK